MCVVYVCTYIGVCINVSIWRSEVNIGCISQLLSTLFLETGSHIEVAVQRVQGVLLTLPSLPRHWC